VVRSVVRILHPRYAKNSTENVEGVRCASLILLGRHLGQTSAQPIEQSKTQHGTIYPKTSIDQHIIESINMKTLNAGERHPEGLFAPLPRNDWETALTVILHSPHYTKIVHEQGSPLHLAIRRGAPVEVVTALLEAYPDATTIRNQYNKLPCHLACFYGISSKGMKMLLRCNHDAVDAMTNPGRSPMHCLNRCNWKFFTEEKEQVRNDLKQLPSYWKSKEQQAVLQCAFEETDRRRSLRRSVARIILARQFDNFDLVRLVIEYL
jgi:ankyrin repeat protein